MKIERVLVTGATGYIGGRLVPELLEVGYTVRCLARTPQKLDGRPWRDRVEVVQGDIRNPDDLRRALDGCDAAHYLVHSMDGEGDFRERDRRAALTFRDAAAAAGVKRIVYLGGLGDEEDASLSSHLRSRHEVGQILASGPVAVTELRAAIIIGSGSASFEMLRNLTEVLPVMTTPRWVDTRCQPIAVRDVLYYLVEALGLAEGADRVYEIGGPDVLTYRQMMHMYAQAAGLRKRVIIPVPVLTPKLSSLWVGLVTPIPSGLARPLIDSLVNEVIVTDPAIDEVLPRRTLTFREALQKALLRVQDLDVTTTWADSELFGRSPAEPLPEDPSWSGGTLLDDVRVVRSSASAEDLFAVVEGIGGDRGYYTSDLLWEIRGLLDQAIGGIGVRRGRRHPERLRVGEPLDFWRVEAIEAGSLLRLRAEMRVPGDAWLEFRVSETAGGSQLEQRARFHPRGLWGRAYWYVLAPFHALIFPKMAQRIAAAAEVRAGRRPPRVGVDDPSEASDQPGRSATSA